MNIVIDIALILVMAAVLYWYWADRDRNPLLSDSCELPQDRAVRLVDVPYDWEREGL